MDESNEIRGRDVGRIGLETTVLSGRGAHPQIKPRSAMTCRGECYKVVPRTVMRTVLEYVRDPSCDQPCRLRRCSCCEDRFPLVDLEMKDERLQCRMCVIRSEMYGKCGCIPLSVRLKRMSENRAKPRWCEVCSKSLGNTKRCHPDHDPTRVHDWCWLETRSFG